MKGTCWKTSVPRKSHTISRRNAHLPDEFHPPPEVARCKIRNGDVAFSSMSGQPCPRSAKWSAQRSYLFSLFAEVPAEWVALLWLPGRSCQVPACNCERRIDSRSYLTDAQ